MSKFGMTVAAAALLAACQPKGATTLSADPASSQAGVWQPVATTMRVYPASRFAAAGGKVVLEARIELLDEMGDSIKGAGRFHVSLMDKQREGLSQVDRQLYTWDVSLLSLTDQQRYYDTVTRTYLFRLKMDEQVQPSHDTRLKVTFTSAHGRTFQAHSVMKSP